MINFQIYKVQDGSITPRALKISRDLTTPVLTSPRKMKGRRKKKKKIEESVSRQIYKILLHFLFNIPLSSYVLQI